MHRTLFTLALSGLLTLGASAALAQDNPPQLPNTNPDRNQDGPASNGSRGRGMRMDSDRQLAHLTRELNLTSDQQDRIKPLLIERQQKMQALFQDQSLAPEDRRRQIRTIAEGTNNSIKSLLNEEKKQKFEAMEERMRHNRREGSPGGPPPPPPDAAQPQL